MSETIRVGQVWRTPEGDEWEVVKQSGATLHFQCIAGPQSGRGTATDCYSWMPTYYTLIRDAPAGAQAMSGGQGASDGVTISTYAATKGRILWSEPAPEKPEVGRWMRHDRASAVHFAYVIPGVDEHPLWTDDGRCLGTKSANMASCFWSPCDPPPWAAEALAQAGIVPYLPGVAHIQQSIAREAEWKKFLTPLADGKPEVKWVEAPKEPRLIPAECVRCGLRIKVAEDAFSLAGNNRCETCGEQYARRMAAEALRAANRADDKSHAEWMRTREGISPCYPKLPGPPVRIESDPYEAPATARGGMVGGIWRKR